MSYGRMPLFPPACGTQNALSMPLFDSCGCARPREECQCVHIQNPACPGEYAEVELCVDAFGNLSICVRRPPKPCCPPPRRCKPRCDCSNWTRG